MAFLFVIASAQARAETIVLGSVVDGATAAAVEGAQVSVRRGGTVLGSAVSDTRGTFSIPFELLGAHDTQQLTLFAEHDAYVPISKVIAVSDGRPDSPSYRFALLPRALASCSRNRDHSVIVGYFRPPASSSHDDLGSRIADALTYNLLTQIQQARLIPEMQPTILACDEAKPQASSDYGGLAKALHADAFLSGYVAPAGSKFKVEMTVADRFDVLVPPARASSPDMDLDDPAAAQLDHAAEEAILRGLLEGYLTAHRNAECVEVTVAAERILGSLPPSIGDVRRRCQEGLGNQGLLPGSGSHQ